MVKEQRHGWRDEINGLEEELKAFMAQNHGSLTSWVTNAVEASIYKLKSLSITPTKGKTE